MPQGNSFEIVKSYRPDIGPSSAKFADIPTRSRYRPDMGMLAGSEKLSMNQDCSFLSFKKVVKYLK